MGRICRVYRVHPHHYAIYGPGGISQALLGEWLGLGQPEVSRLENGPPVRHLDTLQRWALVLGIPSALLWFRLPDDDGWQPPGRDPEPNEPEPLVAGLSGRRISADLADRLAAMVTELRKMDDVAGGGRVLALGQQQFGWVAGLLNKASYDDATARRLHLALADLGQFCGWAAYDAGHVGLAQRYNITALRAAHTADNRLLGAHILGSMAKHAAHLDAGAEASTLVDTALAGMPERRTPRLQAQLQVRSAYAAATRQDRSACTAAISKARSHIEQQDGDDPRWLYWVDRGWITAEAGNCLLRLGHAEQAVPLLREGITQFDDTFVRDRQLYTINLADALARPGKQRDLEAAAALGVESVELAETLESSTGSTHLGDLCQRMTPHGDLPPVRDFLERATAFATARTS